MGIKDHSAWIKADHTPPHESQEAGSRGMISRHRIFGAAFIAMMAVMAVIGWRLGGRDRQNEPVAQATAPAVITPSQDPAPEVPVVSPPAHRAAMPAPPRKTLAPFAPPVPEAPVAPLHTGEGNSTGDSGSLTETGLDRGKTKETVPQSAAPAAQASRPSDSDMRPQAWARNATASPPNPGHLPLIAIVIDDLGIAPARAAAALALPAPVTVAVLPYARDAAQVARAARARGHEVLVHLPMEAANGQDPGAGALLASHTSPELARRLQWNLSRLDGYVGVNNHMGSKLTQDSAAMDVVMAQLKRRGLLFLDSRTARGTLAASTARMMGVTTLERDVFLDNVITSEAIRAQLRKTEETARRKGYAIAIGHPHAATIDTLAQWAAGLEARGFRLVPLSALTLPGASAKRTVLLPHRGG